VKVALPTAKYLAGKKPTVNYYSKTKGF